VFDTDDEPRISAIANELRANGLDVVFSGASGGLAHARNAAIRAAITRYLVFVDDDVTVSHCAVEDLRIAFGAGSQIVGVRLEPGPFVDLSKWYISPSQFHYLGLHREGSPGKTWGACMGLDLNFVCEHGLKFRIELGRKGRSLISGDDTTFVAECLELRACQAFLEHTRVHHHVAQDRLRLRRMLSRALWQGRSEVRRGNTSHGALKEWERNIFGWRRTPLRTLGLAVLYQAMVLLGIAVESAASRGQVSRSDNVLEMSAQSNSVPDPRVRNRI
jgi:hypothetical protein